MRLCTGFPEKTRVITGACALLRSNTVAHLNLFSSRHSFISFHISLSMLFEKKALVIPQLWRVILI